MKYLIYHILTPLGFSADIMTDAGKKDPTYADLVIDEEMRIKEMEKAGFKVIREVTAPQAPQGATTPTTAPLATFCEMHKVEMQQRTSKYGTFYSHSQKVGEENIYCKGRGWGVR